jgi:hypothetical protein
MHRPGDVLHLLLAYIVKAEIDFVPHLFAHDVANADSARLGQAFEPRRDVYAVSINILLVADDVAEIDANAELDAPRRRNAGIPQGHLALPFDCAAHRIDDARKLYEKPVASSLDDMPVMLGNLGFGQLAPDRLQGHERPFLVLAHQPRIAGDISRQYRRQPPLDAPSPGVHGSDATAISSFTIAPESRRLFLEHLAQCR